MPAMHEIDYKIFGDDMQYVEVELDPGEAKGKARSSAASADCSTATTASGGSRHPRAPA